MKKKRILPILNAAGGMLVLLSAACGPRQAPPKSAVSFVDDVKPILQAQCVRCHNDRTIMGGLNLMNREMALRGSKNGVILIPGDAANSALYRVTQLPAEQDHAMPATGAKLTDEEKQIIRRWIEGGADWPAGPDGTMKPITIDSKSA